MAKIGEALNYAPKKLEFQGLRSARTHAEWPPGLHQAMFGKGSGLSPGDDDVVQNLNVDQSQRFLERARQQTISLARLGVPGWMIVREDRRRCVVC
jgi:hypothetical protein